VLWGYWRGGGVLSDLICKSSAEIGLDKSLAVSTDVVLVVVAEKTMKKAYTGLVKNLSRVLLVEAQLGQSGSLVS
jgi:hypothetical protein